MKTRWTKWLSAFGMVILAIGWSACRKRVDPAAPETQELPEGRACPPGMAMIGDGESANKTSFLEGRGGWWYTYVDYEKQGGSEVWPTAGILGGTFEMSEGGANGTKYAARMKGTIGGGELVFAGMGAGLLDPPGPYDASKYGGISFWAKKGPGSTAKVRLKVPDKQTKPEGGMCKGGGCNNDFGLDLVLTDKWVKYTVPFRIMKQVKGWGDLYSGGIDSKSIYEIQFQVDDRMTPTFDIWVDEIQFTGCQ
jgi:endoglucanase